MSANPRKIRKAAVLVASLDREAADIVMNQMSPLQARLVRRAMVELGSPDPVEQNDVIEDFFRTAPRVLKDDHQGIELGDDLLKHAAGSNTHSEHLPHDMRRDISERPLHFLKHAAIEPLIPLLERERPQTIAVVLSHLKPSNAAELLGMLPAALQVEVTHCMLERDQIDPAALQALEEGVAIWLRQHAQVQNYRADMPLEGRAAIKQILSLANAETRQNMLAALPQEQQASEPITPVAPRPADVLHIAPESLLQEPLILESLAPETLAPELDFAQFCQFDLLTAAKIIAEAYPEIAALALLGADATFADRVLEQIPHRQATAIRSNMLNLGPTALADIELAQKEIVRLAQQQDTRRNTVTRSNGRLSVVG
jgi:flagellar motor switch protein FliG